MAFGWAGKILTADLSNRQMTTRDTLPFAQDYLGGRALAARLAWNEIPPSAGPFDPENRVIVATGPLTGTLAPTSGRIVMGSLSPRIYPRPWYTHSTVGGWFGPELKYAGFDAVVIRGAASTPVYLEVTDGSARLVDAPDLWGLDARETQLALKKRLGEQTQVLTIGPAGENRVRFATVQHAEENAAGHSGFGAVWGSKNLKAITVRGTGGVTVAHPDALLEEVLSFGKFRSTPCYSAVTPAGPQKRRPICTQACTFNCLVSSFGQTATGRTIPGQCIGGLAWVTESVMESTRYSGGGIEVPAARNFGLCEEASLHEMCNSLGLDLWFRLVMQPWFYRCEQLGIREIRGFAIAPGDVFWFADFMQDLAYRRGLGDIFAEDLLRAMNELECELPQELIALGRELEFGFGFPAHREGRFWDEEPLPFWVIAAMMYISESRDPSIGTHQSGLLLADWVLHDPDVARRHYRQLGAKVWGDPDALEPTFERKSPIAVWTQNQHVLIDSLPLCDFAFPQVARSIENRDIWQSLDDVCGDLDLDRRLLAAVTGCEFSRDDLTAVAERGFTLERALLARFGRSRRMEESLAPHFKLPCRADGTLIDETGFRLLMDEYYAARGWDLALGWPETECLARLGLADIALEIEALRRNSEDA